MFERFTERARQVVVLAQDEARTLRHNYIGTEHILLGLVRLNEGVAARILLDFDADADRIRNEIMTMLSGPGRKQVRVPEPRGEYAFDRVHLPHLLEVLQSEKERLIETQQFEAAASLRHQERVLAQAIRGAQDELRRLSAPTGSARGQASARWDYRVATLEGASGTWPDQLRGWRKDGWELITVVEEEGMHRALLERRN